MDEIYIEESVRVRLILSGLSELEEHGLADFSLRRAAIGAQVSCAAPYRHFKDKDEYIKEIIKYVNSKWELLSTQINTIFESDPSRLALEMCVANLKFWIANENYRTVFTVALDTNLDFSLDAQVLQAVEKFAKHNNLTDDELKLKLYTVRAIIAGSVMLAASENTEVIIDNVRRKLEFEFKKQN